MTKHLTPLGHRMTRIFPILLLIGLALGQAEPDTSEIDYYQMGIDAAKENFKPKYSYAIGIIIPSPLHLLALQIINPVKINEKLSSILNTKNGKLFKKGYVSETKRLRTLQSLKGSCHTLLAFGVYFLLFFEGVPLH